MRFRLVEDIASFKKRYPEIDDDTFNKLLNLDPTYKGGDNKGNYSQWIMDLYKRIQKQGQAQLRRFTEEDLYKVTDLLKEFDEKRKLFKNKDINQFKSLPELSKALDEIGEGELSHRQEVRQRQKDRKNADLGNEADLVYEDSAWEVWIPKTYAASCKLGQGSRWCTASTESDHYYNYYKKNYGGDYYIIINKSDPSEKYQFHFESKQFMDKDDDYVDVKNFLQDNEGLGEFFKDKFLEVLKPLIENEYISIPKITISEEASNRDMSSDFILSCMCGDIWEYFDNYDGDVYTQYAWDEMNVENRKELFELCGAKYNSSDNIDEQKNNYKQFEKFYNENDDISRAVAVAYNEGNSIGSQDAAIIDCEKSFRNALPQYLNWVDGVTYFDDSSYITLGVDTEWVKKNGYRVYDDLSEALENYDIEEAIAFDIGQNMNFYEPQYGWNDFSTDAYNERLYDELYELKAGKENQ